MKLVINIPCFNEEKTLPLVLRELPTKIKGIDKIEVQIVDDGSTDNTLEVAKKFNCLIIKHKNNKGLGNAFKTGVEVALERGCDIFVNTDADNQYPSKYIKDLVKPVLEGRADLVIGDRNTSKVKHFSLFKKILQKFGSWVVRKLSGSKVQDTVSGFRAYSKEALLQLNVVSKFSYCLDTIVQASKKNLAIVEIPIHTNPPTRKSRLFSNIFQHMYKSGMNLLRCYIMYEPFKTFLAISIVPFIPGMFLLIRFFYYYMNNNGAYIQSLIISSILLIASGICVTIAILSENNAINRQLIEQSLYLKKKEIYKK